MVGALLAMSTQVWAHPSDISRLRVKVEPQLVEMRFTFNLLTLSRFVPGIDQDQDGQVDAEELKKAGPAVGGYLNRHVQMQVNGADSSLGEVQGLEAMWPAVNGAAPPVPAADYPVRHVDILFVRQVRPPLADVWLGFDVWRETGPLGSIEATYEQGTLRTQVPFSMGEPDYLYDTGFAVDEIFKEPAPARQKPADGPPGDWKLYLAGTLISFVVLPLLLFLSSRQKQP